MRSVNALKKRKPPPGGTRRWRLLFSYAIHYSFVIFIHQMFPKKRTSSCDNRHHSNTYALVLLIIFLILKGCSFCTKSKLLIPFNFFQLRRVRQLQTNLLRTRKKWGKTQFTEGSQHFSHPLDQFSKFDLRSTSVMRLNINKFPL